MKPLNSYLEAKMFEDYIWKYLFSNCSEKEKIYRDHRFFAGNTVVDFYLPAGCKSLGYPPKTAVEVKIFFNYPSISRIFQSYYPLYKHGVISKLIVFYKKISINESLNKFLASLKENFISIQEFSEIQEDEKNINNIKPQEISDNTEAIEQAKEAYNNMRYTLFLGAGLSMDAKLPSWSELLESLLKNEKGKPFKFINKANSESISSAMGNSTIITGRYALDGYLKDNSKSDEENRQDFIERIRAVLYRRKGNKSQLIASVSRAIKRKKPEQIITYNYDDLLDELLDKKLFYSVSDGTIPRTKQIPIYHVHGMISRDNTKPSNSVLSEKDYHFLYSNPHNWANVVQLNALYTSTCFFLGFSMTDPNQRRLLELARAKDSQSDDIENLPHFVFLKKEPLKGEASEDVNKEHWEEVEYMMSEFGLNVIWFNEFDELPRILDYISGISKNKPQT